MNIDFSLDSPPPTSPFQRWATEQLDLPTTATGVAARNTLRDRLHDEDFVPPLRWQLAVQVLTEKRAPGQLPPALVLHDEERRLQEEVGEFAGKFFELPPAERQQRWDELLSQSTAQPLVQARLRALEPGLKFVPPPVSGGPLCEELAAQALEQFTLYGATRVARRQAFLAHAKPRMPDYEAAALHLFRNHVDLRLLEPGVIGQIVNRCSQRVKDQAEREQALREARVDGSFVFDAGRTRGDGGFVIDTASTRPSGNGSRHGAPWVAIACILGVLGLLRGLTSTGKGTFTPANAPPTFKFLAPPPVAPPLEDRVANEMVRNLLQNLHEEDRPKLYAELRQVVADAAPIGPPVVERLRSLLPPEVPRSSKLSTDDMRYLLGEIKAGRFSEQRLTTIVQQLAENVRPDRP